MDEVWLIAAATLVSVLAGFIDAVIGGGGLIQVPLMFILFPNTVHTKIIATNRFASIFGTSIAAIKYFKHTKINGLYVFAGGITTAVAAYLGTMIMHKIPTEIFKPILFVIIAILTIYTFLKKEMGQQQHQKIKEKYFTLAFALIGLAMGLYNGSIGPGTGTLLTFLIVQIIGLQLLQASAYTKIINIIADGASLIGFIIQGAVMYKIALPMALGNMLGGYLGSSAAIKKGNGFVRIFFIVVMILLLARLAWDISKTN